MIRLVNLVGARPQIIKASAVSRAISSARSGDIEEIVVHTGQHYDRKMSEVFFEELRIPPPNVNLDVGSGPHGRQTALMITRLEELFRKEKPDVIVVYGDTNSTLAGALAAVKMHIPVVHVEAGMRSFDKRMPEEINRIMTDHVSTLLFSPTIAGFKNLIHEGFAPENSPPYHINNPKIYHSGDIMYDNSLYFGRLAEKKKDFLNGLEVEEEGFVLATIHRESNTDDPARLKSIFRALAKISSGHEVPVIIPLHPRTVKALKALPDGFFEKISGEKRLKIIPPVSFLEMTLLEKKAGLIITDSGGVQKESHFFRKACLVLRPHTEWVELTDNGNALLTDADERRITEGFEKYWGKKDLSFPGFYGDGHTAAFIVGEIADLFEQH
jgi:UDP-GlcNAc3NAcA epimerase